MDEEALSLEKLNETFAPLREAVSASLGEQESLVSSVQAANAQFDAQKSGGELRRGRWKAIIDWTLGHFAEMDGVGLGAGTSIAEQFDVFRRP